MLLLVHVLAPAIGHRAVEAAPWTGADIGDHQIWVAICTGLGIRYGLYDLETGTWSLDAGGAANAAEHDPVGASGVCPLCSGPCAAGALPSLGTVLWVPYAERPAIQAASRLVVIDTGVPAGPPLGSRAPPIWA